MMNALELCSRLRRLFGAAIAAGALVGCATAAPASGPGGGAAPAAGERCEDLRDSAREAVSRVLDQHHACANDADCITVSLSASCFDSCSRTMSAAGEKAFEAARAEVNGAQCARFAAQGCKHVVPPCVPPTPPACMAGRCAS